MAFPRWRQRFDSQPRKQHDTSPVRDSQPVFSRNVGTQREQANDLGDGVKDASPYRFLEVVPWTKQTWSEDTTVVVVWPKVENGVVICRVTVALMVIDLTVIRYQEPR